MTETYVSVGTGVSVLYVYMGALMLAIGACLWGRTGQKPGPGDKRQLKNS